MLSGPTLRLSVSALCARYDVVSQPDLSLCFVSEAASPLGMGIDMRVLSKLLGMVGGQRSCCYVAVYTVCLWA